MRLILFEPSIIIIFIVVLFLTACSTSWKGDSATFEVEKHYIEERLCLGMYEVEYRLSNGSGNAFLGDYPKTYRRRSYLKNSFINVDNEKGKSFHSPLHKKSLNNISDYFVPQSDPNICWAAALETAFRYIGKQYNQDEFVAALKKRCSAKLSKTASVNQMFFAATDRHLIDGGKWIGKFSTRNSVTFDIGEFLKAFSPIYISNYHGLPGHNWTGSPPSRSYSSSYLTVPGIQISQYEEANLPTEEIIWKTNSKDGRLISEGKIKLIKNIAELILVIDSNYPVITGFKQSQGGHTVVISEIEFRPGGVLDTNNTYKLDNFNSAYLNYVYFLDPTVGPEPIGMSGDYFLENAVFMFYIVP